MVKTLIERVRILEYKVKLLENMLKLRTSLIIGHNGGNNMDSKIVTFIGIFFLMITAFVLCWSLMRLATYYGEKITTDSAYIYCDNDSCSCNMYGNNPRYDLLCYNFMDGYKAEKQVVIQ